VKRILVIRFRAMGDVLLATPLLRALKRRWPEARVDYLVEEGLSPLLEGSDDFDRLLAWPRRARPRWLSDLRWALRLRRERYDLLLDLHGNGTSVLFTALSAAPLRIGYRFRGRHYFYHRKIDRRWPSHLPPAYEPRRHFRLVESLGIQPEDLRLRLPTAGRGDPFGTGVGLRVLMAPGATWSAKQWPAEHYGKLADLLTSIGARVFLMGSAGEQELLSRVAAGSAAKVLPSTSIPQMLEAIAAADLLVCTDSGARHVAVAMDTPSLAIFGPSDPRVWSPEHPRHPTIFKDLECRPCMLTECPLKGHPCMNDLTPESVFDRLRGLISSLETADGS